MTAQVDGAALSWTAEGSPRSQRFDDIYFSAADGLAEARAVFLHGCGLPEAWRGRTRYVVGELGFGTGLNILALLQAWRAARTAGQRLAIFSVEAFPLTVQEAARALNAWPELADLAAELLGQWPRRAPGFHRLSFPALDATLDLAIGEAGWALDQWSGCADAWFLDGFSPAKNPQMWRPEVLSALAARSAPDARLGTFTVAGDVRRGLQAAGFEVSKHPGHGQKRERLQGRRAGSSSSASDAPKVAIIGAGIAGAALARALGALGACPLVIEAEGVGARASGNPAALVAPALDAGGGPRAAFYAQALARACDLYGALGDAAVGGRGHLQLAHTERDPRRFAAVTASGAFDPDRLHSLGAEQAAAMSGQPLNEDALLFADSLVIRPQAVLQAWLTAAETQRATAAQLEHIDGAWRIWDGEHRLIAEADAVCIAAGIGGRSLDAGLGLLPIRGQASWAADVPLNTAMAWGGYAAPFDGGLVFGATHDRDREDRDLSALDHRRNLASLAEVLPAMAAGIDPDCLQGRAEIRAATPDRMPLAGALGPDGLYVLGGLGSRGFTTAPVLGEHIAAQICGAPSPLPADVCALLNPGRISAT
ncbi:MAG TPA: FAD-dependent 5-carboxymethylaminomethyl-2-thiouridine(34) oxidoreductase MnmC [Caulobacteraceae bacterium]|nr:FAD-dependent 5-carboxymethylaminomethyl-2-thiouridine(34) oxidoreductase MnmC [Caulobacteraceae bacterium]